MKEKGKGKIGRLGFEIWKEMERMWEERMKGEEGVGDYIYIKIITWSTNEDPTRGTCSFLI